MSLGLKKGLPGLKKEGSLEDNRAVVFVHGANKINKKPIDPYPRSLWLFAPGGRQCVTVVASMGKARESAREGEKNKFKKKGKERKGDMEPDPQVLEGWAAGQERQAVEHAEQMELLRVQAGLQTQALLQLAGGGGPASGNSKKPNIHLPKISVHDDAQAFLEAFEVAAEACHWP